MGCREKCVLSFSFSVLFGLTFIAKNASLVLSLPSFFSPPPPVFFLQSNSTEDHSRPLAPASSSPKLLARFHIDRADHPPEPQSPRLSFLASARSSDGARASAPRSRGSCIGRLSTSETARRRGRAAREEAGSRERRLPSRWRRATRGRRRAAACASVSSSSSSSSPFCSLFSFFLVATSLVSPHSHALSSLSSGSLSSDPGSASPPR